MTRIRLVLLGVTLLLFFIRIWLWWNRSSRVDMSLYVPADSLIYLEANDLPQIITALASTEAWRELVGAAQLDLNTTRLNLLANLAARTGIGPAEAVVMSRAQIAVVLLGIEAAGTEAATSDPIVKPRVAVVIEAHTGERRVRLAVDKLVGDLA